MAPPCGQQNLDYAQNEEDTQRPSAETERAASLDLYLLLPRTSNTEQLGVQLRTLWLLQDIQQIVNGTRTMADIISDHRRPQHLPSPTMEHPNQWH